MKTKSSLLGREIDSPVGKLTLLASEKGLAGIHFENRYHDSWEQGQSSFLDQAESEMQQYFAEERTKFEVSLDPQGTDFQRSVWNELSKIPYGVVVSYLDIAKGIRNPKAVRAVGLANGANPISIIIPCHRVIGANGKLTGYGGGLERKQKLLKHEKAGFLL